LGKRYAKIDSSMEVPKTGINRNILTCVSEKGKINGDGPGKEFRGIKFNNYS